MTALEVAELTGIDPTRVLRESINDVTISKPGVAARRYVSFTAQTAAGLARVRVEVDQ